MFTFLRTTFLNISVLESYFLQQRKENRSEEVNGFVFWLCDVAAHVLTSCRLLQRLPYFNVGL